jgi:hypothetical protein
VKSEASCWVDIARFDDREGYSLAHQQGGFLPSEGHALLQLCKLHGISYLIESGRWRGFSTEMLASCANPPLRIASVDLRFEPFYREVEQRLRRFPNVRLHYGNSLAVVPHLVATGAEPMALFIDGPKGTLAVNLIKQCFALSPNLRLAFLHDSYRGSDARVAVEREFRDAWFTDDPDYCRRFHHLDGLSADTYRRLSEQADFDGKYLLSIEKIDENTSYGPTLACIRRPEGLDTEKTTGRAGIEFFARRLYAEAYAKLRLLLKGV